MLCRDFRTFLFYIIFEMNKKINVLLTIFGILILQTSCWLQKSQYEVLSCEEPWPIYINDFNLMSQHSYKRNRKEKSSQLELNVQSTYKFRDTVYQLTQLNCTGKSEVKIYVKKKLLLEANYDSRGIVNYDGVDAPSRKYENEFVTYAYPIIQPYRHGKWTYYDKNGLVLRVEFWDRGIIDSKVGE